MAIRLGPPPALARLRLQWHVTRNQVFRQSRALQERFDCSTQFARDWWLRALTLSRARLDRRQRLLARQKAQFAAFTERYENLVDLLCLSANEGVFPNRVQEYAETRLWLQKHYAAVRPALQAHLPEQRSLLDPFQSLFVPETLEEVINSDDTIENIMLTRPALEAYQNSLHSDAPRA